jgi:hypothetical protein
LDRFRVLECARCCSFSLRYQEKSGDYHDRSQGFSGIGSGWRRRGFRVRPVPYGVGRDCARGLLFRPAFRRALGLSRPCQSGRGAHAAESGFARQFVASAAGLHHLHGRPDPHHGRPGRAPETPGIPGEHDASLDNGAAFKELFGPSNYTFDHKGVHFITIDNVSDPGGRIGDAQLEWLRQDLAAQPQDARIVVFTHRPLFALVPKWDWTTRDGDKALALLMSRPNVTVFYGHIHQEHHHMTGHITHHAATSLIYPLPAPGSQEKRTPLPWDPAMPYKGLGFREVESEAKQARYQINQFPLVRS